MVIQPDEKIVLAGYSEGLFERRDFALARYNRNGSLDATFGSGGIIATTLSGLFQDAQALAIQDDGKLIVGGQTLTGSVSRGRDFALLRYSSVSSQ
jgi:uncharacterized delta-60 repeat protein